MDTYERLKDLCKQKGVTVAQMESDNGITRGNANKWRRSMPNYKMLMKLSEYFGVSTGYILTGEENGIFKDEYYFDEEANTIAQEIANRPGMKTLLEASRKLPDTDLQYVNDLVKRLVNKE